MCFVDFNSMSNLIVIMFNLLYLVFHVGFNCKGCVCERERGREREWRLKALKTEVFSRVTHDLASREVMHVPCTWLECEESGQMEATVFRECLVGKAFLQDTHKIFYFTRLSFLILCLHYLYPYYPQMLRSVSERKPKPQTLKVRDCYTHIPLHICLWIFLNYYLSISIPLRGW